MDIHTSNSTGPDSSVIDLLPYSYLLPKESYVKIKKLRWKGYGYFQKTTVFLIADSIKTKAQKRRANIYLAFPITGISADQARNHCSNLSKLYNEELAFYGTDSIVIEMGLPEKALYERIIERRDSTNGICSVFNYSSVNCNVNLSKRTTHLKPGNALTPNWGYGPSELGLYNLHGNAAEMTDSEGIAMGGSYAHPAIEAAPDQYQLYDKPMPWLGFRCVAHIKR